MRSRHSRRFGSFAAATIFAFLTIAASNPSDGLAWATSSARLTARAIAFDGETIAVPHSVAVHSDPGDPSYRTLEVGWDGPDGPYRMAFWLRADANAWWVDEIVLRTPATSTSWAIDGLPPFPRTVRGASLAADIHLSDPPLDIEGLHLTAFMPGTGPAPLTECRHLRADEALETAELVSLPPAKVGHALAELGICFTYRYGYPLDRTDLWYSERWCETPPAGVVAGLDRLDDGEVIVFVRDERPRAQREQPPEGWGCDAW